MTLTFLGAVPDEQWKALLVHHLEVADSWAVNVPDGDGPLSNGREVFAALPAVETRPWEGMHGAVSLTGPMTSQARATFLTAESSLITLDPQRKLWDYQLLRGNSIALQVSDFTDLMLQDPDVDVLRRLGLGEDVLAQF